MTRLPAELVDAILDALSLDRSNLATCGLVSSSWLARTRFHLFSTVTLTPSRVGKLQEISYAKGSTFLESVGKVVIKDFDNDGEHGALECMVPMLLEATILLLEKYPRLCELQLENLEWTTIPPPLQASLIRRLCRLRTIRRLSLENVTFHDLRDVVHLMSAFPHLQHLVARIYFTKYMEFAISSAQTLHLPHTLRTIDLGTHDATAVILSCRFRSPSLETLRLQNISFASLQYVCDALSTLGSSLRHLALEFSHPKLTGVCYLQPAFFLPLGFQIKLKSDVLLAQETLAQQKPAVEMEGISVWRISIFPQHHYIIQRAHSQTSRPSSASSAPTT